jgi:hypothetical protein
VGAAVFRSERGDQAVVQMRIANLIHYLESLQEK